MASKKYKLLFGILILMSYSAFAQPGVRGGVNDTSKITRKRMPQANEFWNGAYNFPAKPRNMWEVGVSTGIFTVSGDFPAAVLTYPNFGVHVRKAFGYIFSLRLQYLDAIGKGTAWNINQNFLKNPAWNTNIKDISKRYFAPDALLNASSTGRTVYTDHEGRISQFGDVVYYNYKVHMQDLSLQGIVTLNNIRFHKQKTGMIIYGGAGAGASIYKTMVNALDAKGNPYRKLFNDVYSKFGSGEYAKRKDILKALKDGMDKTYETAAENQGVRRPKFLGGTLKPSATVLAGIAFKLGRRINLAIEDRWTFVKDDLVDGQRWQEHAWGDAALTRDYDSYNYASIGLNFNLGAKSVEPLWWLNPLDYAYDELIHHKHPKPLPNDCLDDDGDGVCNHLDVEVTPAGCPVDTHGKSRDTDGDGVVDCLDKELITPTKCQPVDVDGIGKCPDPECCKPIPVPDKVCTICSELPPFIIVKGNELSGDNKAELATIAAIMKANPNCKIVFYQTAKKDQDKMIKVNAIKTHLHDIEGIDNERISVNGDKLKGSDFNKIIIKCN